MHVFLHFGTYGLMVLQLILASKLSELEQCENFAANNQFSKQKKEWKWHQNQTDASLLLKMDLFLLNFAFFRKFHGNFIILANGYILGQNSRKLTPLQIPFYCQDNITLPTNTFFNACEWHQFDLVSFLLLFAF